MDAKRLLEDPIYFKIISFFHENPTSIDTPRGISAWIGENRQISRKALLKLAGLKILTAHKVTSTTGYSYTRNQALIKKIDHALKRAKSIM